MERSMMKSGIVSLAALLLVSQGVQANDGCGTGTATLAHLNGEDANHCVSFDWIKRGSYQYQCGLPTGEINHPFTVENNCERTILFRWRDNGQCWRKDNVPYPCALFINSGHRNFMPGLVHCAPGRATITWIADFVE